MSEPNIDVVKQYFSALDARDLDALSAVVAPDAVWNTPAAIPFGGVLHGPDGVRALITDAWGFFADYRNTRDRVVADGDRVVVAGHHLGRGSDGSDHDVPYLSVFTVRDGLITSASMQVDAGLVVKAVAGELASDTGS